MDESLGEALEAAAVRQRQSAVGGRREGAATAALDKLGTAIYNLGAGPSRLINSAMQEYQPGVSVQDMPQTMQGLPEVAANVVGMPGITGGVPVGSLGAVMSGSGWKKDYAGSYSHTTGLRIEKSHEGGWNVINPVTGKVLDNLPTKRDAMKTYGAGFEE